jgi:hypothetical protein
VGDETDLGDKVDEVVLSDEGDWLPSNSVDDADCSINLMFTALATNLMPFLFALPIFWL